MKKQLKQIDKDSVALHLDTAVYAISTRTKEDNSGLAWQLLSSRNWEALPISVGGRSIVPWGTFNTFPSQIRDIVEANNLAPGIIDRQMGLLYGQGLYLSKIVYDDGKPRRLWLQDDEIQAWLDGWDYKGYIKGCMSDYLHLRCFFSAHFLERGWRIGRPARISHLEHLPASNCRLEWVDSRNLADVSHIVVGDFERGCYTTGITTLPVFDRANPAAHPVSASYNRSAAYGRDFYSVPQYFGSLNWILRGSNIPTIFKYVTENGINVAYHVHSPQVFWEKKRSVLADSHPEWSSEDLDAAINAAMTEQLNHLTEVLSGDKNSGKFLHTVDYYDADSNEVVSWKVEPIDQKMKDFVESQLKISDASVSAITSGMGLHPALSNVMVQGKLASGSELMYAHKLFQLSDVQIPSEVLLRNINEAIAFNFPHKKGIELAFYHQAVEVEENVSPSNRIKNQQPL